MTRSHILARTLGLAAFAALTSLAAPHAARAQSYTVTDLTLAGQYGGRVLGVSGGTQVGESIYEGPFLWHGAAGSAVNLTPTNLPTFSGDDGAVYSVSGNNQVGQANYYGGAYSVPHALLWHGTADSAVDLNPAGSVHSSAYGVSGDTQVGFSDTMTAAGHYNHAYLWHGTAASGVDLHPFPLNASIFHSSVARAASDDTQVGSIISGGLDAVYHAYLWHGTAASGVDLHPAGYNQSQILGLDGDTQVGFGKFPNGGSGFDHALLWHGAADSVVDLHQNDKYIVSQALSVLGNVQVGYGYDTQHTHALLWHGTAQSAFDLNLFLPKTIVSAVATGISSNGDIVGYGYDTKRFHALLWHPITATLKIISISPDPVDVGHAAFTLTVSGTAFAPSTVVRYNGQTLATTYVSPTQVKASAPAPLLTSTGTADITLQTPGVATTSATPFHIRPVISSLSPSTAPRGSAFTLTVNGAGYTTNSIVVLSGANLATTYLSSTQLTATVPASLLTVAHLTSVMVTIPHVATSRGAAFLIE